MFGQLIPWTLHARTTPWRNKTAQEISTYKFPQIVSIFVSQQEHHTPHYEPVYRPDIFHSSLYSDELNSLRIALFVSTSRAKSQPSKTKRNRLFRWNRGHRAPTKPALKRELQIEVTLINIILFYLNLISEFFERVKSYTSSIRLRCEMANGFSFV